MKGDACPQTRNASLWTRIAGHSDDRLADQERRPIVRAIETHGTVSSDGHLSVQLPPNIPPGEHRVVVVIEEEAMTPQRRALPEFPVIDPGPWPEWMSMRREDMYSAGRG